MTRTSINNLYLINTFRRAVVRVQKHSESEMFNMPCNNVINTRISFLNTFYSNRPTKRIATFFIECNIGIQILIIRQSTSNT